VLFGCGRRSVGCVISPAGFATTSRSSSSNRTGTGGPSGAGGASSRSTATTRSPPPSRKDFGRIRPSTVTSPAAIALWTSAREVPSSLATTASSRPGTATNSLRLILGRRIHGVLTSVAERGHREQDRADHDGAVRRVEHGPDV